MARIRSIHPGIWTDEDFAGLSMAARVLYFGILTEADDHGVFEWKPTGLKMRIFPADKIGVEPLLAELTEARKVAKMPSGDGHVGLVRNFRKYQRPKKPTYRYVFNPKWAPYVGLTEDSSEVVENQFGTGTEIPPQRKEEGGRREKKKEDTADAALSKYAFENGVIKLNKRDLERWKASFSHLDVPAELIAMTAWVEKQPGNWFHLVPNALAKRNREVKAAKEKQAQEPFKWNGMEGVL